MSSLEQRLLAMVEQARGRCHSCANQRIFDLPVTGPVYYCRVYGSEYGQDTRDQVRNCPRWAPFRPTDAAGRFARASRNPLFNRIIEAEDHLFWQLKVRLDELGADLKTVMLLAQPALRNAAELDWVDSLERRFGDGELEPDVASLAEIVDELRAHRYDSICEVLDRLVLKSSGSSASDDAARNRR